MSEEAPTCFDCGAWAQLTRVVGGVCLHFCEAHKCNSNHGIDQQCSECVC